MVQLPTGLLAGKSALVVGIANENSIAYGCAKAFRALGAELAVTYLNEKAKPHVAPLAEALGAPVIMPLDVRSEDQLDELFAAVKARWGGLDVLVHSIAYAPKADDAPTAFFDWLEFAGGYVDGHAPADRVPPTRPRTVADTEPNG